mgnify:FL=1|tara:strand:- start:58 stop:348 length:291 start_codon:yes stop_codon:yes gene_type:complete
MTFTHTFESGWTVSVVEWGMGAEDGLLEIAVMKDGEWDFDNPIGTKGYLTDSDIVDIIGEISHWKADETFADGWEENHSGLIEILNTIHTRWADEE